MADHEDPEFVMSQVKLAATYKAAGDLPQAISLTCNGKRMVLADCGSRFVTVARRRADGRISSVSMD